MTEHTVTVEETVESEETVWTCDYCGLSADAGEMIEFQPAQSDVGSSAFVEEDLEQTIPAMHYHLQCIESVVADDEETAKLTLSEQYKRRTGNGLLVVFPTASSVPITFTLGFAVLSAVTSGVLSIISFALAMLIGGLTLIGARKMAKQTVKEFAT